MVVIDEDELRRLIPLDEDVSEERLAVVSTPSPDTAMTTNRFNLQSIRIENFKSYSGVIEVSEFPKTGDDSLICVVGPNGSGKSNLMDAVAFCFNCADSTKLRGDGVLSNLISGGIPSSQTSSAVVAITLADERGEAVVFARTVNSKNESRYKLNNRSVALEKYRDKMVECGLDVRGNFLVFQGDVESLALSTPSELGSAIDRVSGSLQYKKEYDSLKEKRIDQERNLTVLMSRRRNLTSERKRMSTELAEIEKLKSLKTDISLIRTKRVLAELYSIQESLVHAESNEPEPMEVDDSTNLLSELDNLKSKRARTDLSKSKTERLIVRAKESLSEAQSEYSSKQSRATVLSSRKLKFGKDLEIETSNQDQIKNQIGKVSAQIEMEGKNLEIAAQDLDDWISRKAAGNPDFDSDTQIVIPHLSLLAGTSIEYSSFKSVTDPFRKYALPVAIECEKANLVQVDNELVHVDSLLTSLRNKESEMSDQLERNVVAEKRANERFSEYETSANEGVNESKKLKSDYESINNRVSRFSQKLDELLERKQTLIDSISAAKETEEQIRKEKSMIEIVSELCTKFGDRKVFGRIVDLVTPVDPQWTTAVEIAAGKYLDAILVSDTNVAKECHGFVKKNNLQGRKFPSLTFIPVTDVSVPPPVVVGECKRVFDIFAIKNSTENLGPEAEYVEQCIKRGLEFVFNDCVICSTMKEGRKIAFDRSVKVVTKNGEKISGKNGTITIGGQGGANKRFNVKQVTEINGKLDVIESQISAARADICLLENEGEKLSRKIREVEIRVNDEVRNREIWKTEVGRIGVQIDAVGKALQQVREETKVANDREKELMEKRHERVNAVRAAIELKVKEWIKMTFGVVVDDCEILALIGGSENDVGKSGQNQFEEVRVLKRKKKDEIESKIESLKNERRFLKEKLEELNDRINELEAERSEVVGQTKKLDKEIDKAKKLVEDEEKKLNDLNSEVEKILCERSVFDGEIRKVLDAIADVDKRNGLNRRPSQETRRLQRDELIHKSVKILKQAVFDNIIVPLEFDESELVENVEEMSRRIIEALYMSLTSIVPASSQRGESDSIENLTREVLMKVNYSCLESSIKRSLDRAVRHGDLEDKLGQLLLDMDSQVRVKQGELDKLNVHSVFVSGHDPSEIDSQLESIGEQIESLKSDLSNTVNELKRIRSLRNDLFMKCFNFVATKVGELYQILTSYDTHDGSDMDHTSSAIVPASSAVASLDLEAGGMVSSESEVFDSGIIFSLMPPFKRYTNIELLSGGEKTVAAVALLFSMLAYSSPPFAMVDEIDAALDAGNVAVLYRFMRHAVKHPVIVISLKEKMYSKADYLIGVYKDVTRGGSSGLVTIDLRAYEQDGQEAAAMGG